MMTTLEKGNKIMMRLNLVNKGNFNPVHSTALKALLRIPSIESVVNKNSREVTYPVLAKDREDLPALKEMEKKWGKLAGNHYQLYENSFDAYWFVGKLLNAKELNPSFTKFYTDPKEYFNRALSDRNQNYFYL